MSNRESNLLMGLVVLLTGIGVYFGLLPLVSGYQRLAEALDEQSRKLRRDRGLLRRAAHIRTRARRTRRRMRRMIPGPLPEDGFSEILSRIEEQALRAGLNEEEIDQINQVSDRTHRGIRELQVRARFVGVTPRQLIHLLWRFRTRLGRTTMMRYKRLYLQRDETTAKRARVELAMVFYGLAEGVRTAGEDESR